MVALAGKLNRGLTVVHTLEALSPEPLTPEQIKQAAILGWCIEWVRRGTPQH